MREPLHIVLRCAESVLTKVRYVFDTLLIARGVPVTYSAQPPAAGPWLFYGNVAEASWPVQRSLAIAHSPEAWQYLEREPDLQATVTIDGLVALFPQGVASVGAPSGIPFDIAANAFFILSSWSERVAATTEQTRRLYQGSIYSHLGVPQNIVDLYLDRMMDLLYALCDRLGVDRWRSVEWPEGATYAVVLSHDIDFIPSGIGDVIKQGAKTVLRHLLRQRDPADAIRAAVGLARALMQRRDPYGCVPEIIKQEQTLGVRSSFQVAVGHRHPDDVNYRIEDDRIRDYLRAIPAADFDLCLHGSYRSTEDREWYLQEVALLTQRLCRPLGSRQHFLSFYYDNLFSAQEDAGIQYDMSMGFPDRIGPRAGFSYPYFPYCLEEDRPYDVLEISLFLMDVTVRGYMDLKGQEAWKAMELALDDVCRKRGCVSVVWHPIVFGGARDPGFDRLYWRLVERVLESGGLATDGRTINELWRRRAAAYPSFQGLASA